MKRPAASDKPRTKAKTILERLQCEPRRPVKVELVTGAPKPATVDYRTGLIQKLSRDLTQAAAYLEEVLKNEDYETLKIASGDVVDALRERAAFETLVRRG